MTEKQDYLIYDSAFVMNSKQPMKQIDVCAVCTKNYIFYIPKKTVGLFLLFNTIRNHSYFNGVSVEAGVRRLVQDAPSVEELEKSLIALVEGDEKCVHKISDQSSFKFRGFLGKHTLRMATALTNWSSISPNGRGNSKEMRAFYGQ